VNITQLEFQITGLDSNKELELSHIHIPLVKNVSANFNSSENKSNFLTFDNVIAVNGDFSTKYRFLEAGVFLIG
jgi:hypothetical protein